MIKVFVLSFFIFFTLPTYSQEQPEPQNEETLLKKAEGLWDKYNPFRSKPKAPAQQIESTESPKAEALQPEQPIKDVKSASASSDFRLIPTIGLGTIEMRSDKKADDINRSFSPNPSASFSILGDYRYPPGPYSFEFGIGILSISSDVVGYSSTSMNLMYLTIPFNLRYNFSTFGKASKLFLKGGITPALLLTATVDSCTSMACGLDDDIDDYFTESKSVSHRFNKQDVLASIGVGMDAHIFEDFIFDAMWFVADISYYQGLMKINKGSEFGSKIFNQGTHVNLGIAIDF